MSEYKKSCYKCNQPITMSDRNLGKWLPFESDGTSLHYCPEPKSTTTKKQQAKPLTLEDLDLRLRMVESIVIKGAKK